MDQQVFWLASAIVCKVDGHTYASARALLSQINYSYLGIDISAGLIMQPCQEGFGLLLKVFSGSHVAILGDKQMVASASNGGGGGDEEEGC